METFRIIYQVEATQDDGTRRIIATFASEAEASRYVATRRRTAKPSQQGEWHAPEVEPA